MIHNHLPTPFLPNSSLAVAFPCFDSRYTYGYVSTQEQKKSPTNTSFLPTEGVAR